MCTLSRAKDRSGDHVPPCIPSLTSCSLQLLQITALESIALRGLSGDKVLKGIHAAVVHCSACIAGGASRALAMQAYVLPWCNGGMTTLPHQQEQH